MNSYYFEVAKLANGGICREVNTFKWCELSGYLVECYKPVKTTSVLKYVVIHQKHHLNAKYD